MLLEVNFANSLSETFCTIEAYTEAPTGASPATLTNYTEIYLAVPGSLRVLVKHIKRLTVASAHAGLFLSVCIHRTLSRRLYEIFINRVECVRGKCVFIVLSMRDNLSCEVSKGKYEKNEKEI